MGRTNSGIASPVAPHGTESSAGGGNAVVCFKSQAVADTVAAAHGNLDSKLLGDIESVEMLDLYHARQPRGASSPARPEIFPIDASQEDPVSDYVKQTLLRYKDQIPALGVQTSQILGQVSTASFHFSESGIRRIDDARSDEQLDNRCLLVTMAAQNLMGEKGELIIDSRLYNHEKHSELSKAVLLLHESLYLIARRQGKAADSKGVREAISYLIVKSPKFKLSELVNALNAMIPGLVHPYRSTLEYKLHYIISDQVSRFLLTTYPKYCSDHPVHDQVIERAEKMLNRAQKRCLSHTPMGCLFPIMRMPDEQAKDFPAEEFKEARRLLVETLKEESHDLDEIIGAEWQKSNPIAEVFPSYSRGPHEIYQFIQLQRTIAGIPSYILPTFVGPKLPQFFKENEPFVLIRSPDIVEYILYRWHELVFAAQDPELPPN